eukprot:Gb_22361 [translate_table: standard]
MIDYEQMIQLVQELRSQEERYVEENILLREQVEMWESKDPHGSSSREGELLGQIVQLKKQLASIPIAVELPGAKIFENPFRKQLDRAIKLGFQMVQMRRLACTYATEWVKAFWRVAGVHYQNLLAEMYVAGSLPLGDDDFHPGVLMGDAPLRRMMFILRIEEWRSSDLIKCIQPSGTSWIGNCYLFDPLFMPFSVGVEASARSFVESHRWHGEALEGSQVLGVKDESNNVEQVREMKYITYIFKGKRLRVACNGGQVYGRHVIFLYLLFTCGLLDLRLESVNYSIGGALHWAFQSMLNNFTFFPVKATLDGSTSSYMPPLLASSLTSLGLLCPISSCEYLVVFCITLLTISTLPSSLLAIMIQLVQELRSQEERYVEENILLREQVEMWESKDPHGSSSREGELLGQIVQLKKQLASIPIAVELSGAKIFENPFRKQLDRAIKLGFQMVQMRRLACTYATEWVKAFWRVAGVHYQNLLAEMYVAGSLPLGDDDFHPGVLMGDAPLRRMMFILRIEEWRSRVVDWHADYLRALATREAYQNKVKLVIKMWGEQKAQLENSALIGVQARIAEFIESRVLQG